MNAKPGNMDPSAKTPRIITITGGSGSGKSHLARLLQNALAPHATILTLDHFYHDLTHLPPAERALVNFDDPAAIDWPALEAALATLLSGHPTEIPEYDFHTHTRSTHPQQLHPAPFIILEGLWPLTRPAIRQMSHLTLFVDCPADLRLKHRTARDTTERGRTPASVLQQFNDHVLPMHDIHVQPQLPLADLTITSPVSPSDLAAILARITPIPA